MSQELEERFREMCAHLDGEVEDRGGHLECETDRLPPEGSMVLDEAVVARMDLPDEEAPRRVTHSQEVQTFPEAHIFPGMEDDMELENTGEKAIFISTDYGESVHEEVYGTGRMTAEFEDADVPIIINNWETGNNIERIDGAENIGETSWTS